MALTAKKLFDPANLTVDPAVYYAVPDNAVAAIIQKLVVVNSDASPRTFSMWLVPLGGTAGITNVLYDEKELAAGETFDCTAAKNLMLTRGGTLQAEASVADQLTIHGSGIEITQSGQ